MIKKILVAVDLSTKNTTKSLCLAANDMAENFDAKVQLVTVVPNYGTPLVASFFPENAQTKIKQEMKSKLSALVEEYFDREVKIAVLQGAKLASTILLTANEIQPDLLMLGCRRKNSRDGQRLFGSTTMAVADRAHCSVMVIRD